MTETRTWAFDCCVVYNAFPHFPEPERLIGKLAGLFTVGFQVDTVLSDGGKYVVSGMLPPPEGGG